MRTFTIALVAAFVLLLAQQLAAAPPWLDQEEERGASQAVISGSIKCFFDPEFRHVALDTFGGLGIIATPIPAAAFSTFAVHSGPLATECSEVIPSLAEQVPHPVCEIGSTLQQGDAGIELFFLCTGRTDAVIAGVGKMARAVNRLGQP